MKFQNNLRSVSWGSVLTTLMLSFSTLAFAQEPLNFPEKESLDTHPEAIASCLVSSLSENSLFQIGRNVGLTGELPHPSVKDVKACDSANELSDEVLTNKPLQAQLALNAAFRKGLYSALSDVRESPEVQKSLGEVGILVEQFYQARLGAKTCLQAPSDLIDMMQDTDLPMVTAMVGYATQTYDQEQAKLLAQAIIHKASAAFELIQVTHCIGARDTEFRAYAKHLDLFMQGTHPKAPGCRLSVNGAGSELSCEVSE